MNISVFCGASLPHNSNYTNAARELGRLIAQGGHTLLYGGSNLGLMGIVSGRALEYGGRVVGVIPSLFSEEIIRSQPVSKLVRVDSIAQRKQYLIAHSDAFIALPGGIGTVDETFEVLVSNQLGLIQKPIGLLDTNHFYQNLIAQLGHMETEGFYNLTNAGYLILEDQPERLLQNLASYRPTHENKSANQRLCNKK